MYNSNKLVDPPTHKWKHVSFSFFKFFIFPKKEEKNPFFLRTEAKLCDKALLPTTKGSQRVNSQRQEDAETSHTKTKIHFAKMKNKLLQN